VLEHLTEPLEVLRAIKECMKPGGKIIIEVPHASDFLITTLNSEAFKAFTFWSEHLILHTRQSLDIFLKEAGFKNTVVFGYQRFPLANHLYWIACGKPGGHITWAHLVTPEIDKAYFELLNKLDQTDTLIAMAEV
jgi:SAM-dependent methyltransferase